MVCRVTGALMGEVSTEHAWTCRVQGALEDLEEEEAPLTGNLQ